MDSSSDDELEQWLEEEEEIAAADDDLYISIALLAEAEEEEKRNKKKQRGAIPGSTVVPRDRRRFRMSKNLFLRIVDEVESHDDYFRQRANAVGLLGATPVQKIVGVFRMLAYGVPADNVDDVVSLVESTMNEAFKHFVRAVVEKFGEHLRWMTQQVYLL
ncbi:uncharacterized protein LOC112270905 isoform X2 [Brachypodium distachyon]|uniref:uncharacterized protein LOC112270905 isoform X2 n=1 Tax=Brachypodium distachyon TaxID=15368 RepID=UPI000D0CBBBF|nr:uncharacterized protein LOC112270905 isoform X2 [Brachypodium distachyon]|eukprot:XP_024315278.1 uncharacterized protein LOC112270905 isoform X2 [Brachypodium distachyon]